MILNFSKADRAEIGAVLCSAFRDYPVMRYVLAGSTDRNEPKSVNCIPGAWQCRRPGQGKVGDFC